MGSHSSSWSERSPGLYWKAPSSNFHSWLPSLERPLEWSCTLALQRRASPPGTPTFSRTMRLLPLQDPGVKWRSGSLPGKTWLVGEEVQQRAKGAAALAGPLGGRAACSLELDLRRMCLSSSSLLVQALPGERECDHSLTQPAFWGWAEAGPWSRAEARSCQKPAGFGKQATNIGGRAKSSRLPRSHGPGTGMLGNGEAPRSFLMALSWTPNALPSLSPSLTT